MRQRIEPSLHVRAKPFARVVSVLQQAQCFADDFACRLVQAALYLLVHEPFELGRE